MFVAPSIQFAVLAVALFLIGAVVAIVSSIVYAIRHDRPGVIVMTLGGLFCMMVLGSGLVYFGSMSSGPANWQVQVGDRAGNGHSLSEAYQNIGSGNTAGPNSTNDPWGMNFDPSRFHFHTGRLKGAGILTFVFLGFIAMWIFRRGVRRDRRGSWFGTALVVLIIVVFGAWLLPPTSRNAQHAREIAEQSNKEVAEAQRQIAKAQAEIQKAQQAAVMAAQTDGHANPSSVPNANATNVPMRFQELWDKFTEPRIKLSGDGSTATISEMSQTNSMQSSNSDSRSLSQTIGGGDNSQESVAQSLARLEQLARQISTVARDVSEIAAVVAKATVVQPEGNRTIPNQPQPQIPQPPVPPAPNVVVHSPVVPAAAVSSPQPASKHSKAAKKSPAPADEIPVAIVPVQADSQGKPAWTNEPTKRVGNVRRQILVTDEFATDEECNQNMDAQLKLATADYVKQFVGAQGKGTLGGAAVPSPEAMGIGVDYIRREIAKDDYMETVDRSFGPMKKLYTLVEFSPSVDADLHRQWDAYRRQSRFSMVGMGAASILGLLGMTLGLLKVDTATKGYYSKRLFIGVPAAIIGLATLVGFAIGHK